MSAWNTTMSSSRLTNSGLNAWRTSACTASSFCSVESDGSMRYWLPRFDVRIEDRVAEVDRAALAVGEAAVVEHLQQHVEDLGVRLLDLVEQDHRVRAPAHGLGELAALLVADVAGRGADEARDGELLAVLAHVDADHRAARRRRGTPRAPWRARSCRRRSGRGTGRSRSGGRGRRCPRGCGARRPRPRAPRPSGRSAACRARSRGAAASRSRPAAGGRPGCRSTGRRPRRCPRR